MTALTNFLLNAGYTRVRRTANRWIKGVYDDNYRTTTSKNHPYTEPDYDDPYALIERIVLDQEKRFVTKQQEHLDSGEDVYAVITGDWHAPDQDPAAMELGMQIAGDWTAGAVNALGVNLGDYACYPTLHPRNKVPFAITLASPDYLGNMVLQTMQGAVQLLRDWREIIPDWYLLEGNHDNQRLFRALFETKGKLGEIVVMHWIADLVDTGVIWMGPNSHQLFLREDIKVLHGNYARQGAGNAIRFQMEKDRFAYRYWFQGHVHRSAAYTAYSDDGSVHYGYEVGHMQMNPPLYGTGRLEGVSSRNNAGAGQRVVLLAVPGVGGGEVLGSTRAVWISVPAVVHQRVRPADMGKGDAPVRGRAVRSAMVSAGQRVMGSFGTKRRRGGWYVFSAVNLPWESAPCSTNTRRVFRPSSDCCYSSKVNMGVGRDDERASRRTGERAGCTPTYLPTARHGREPRRVDASGPPVTAVTRTLSAGIGPSCR